MAKFRSHPQPTVHISGPKRKSQMSALRIVGGDKSSRAVWLRCRGAYRQEQQQQTTAFDHVSIPCCNNPCSYQSAQTISDTGKEWPWEQSSATQSTRADSNRAKSRIPGAHPWPMDSHASGNSETTLATQRLSARQPHSGMWPRRTSTRSFEGTTTVSCPSKPCAWNESRGARMAEP